MEINFLTIFPHIFDSYINESIIKRAVVKKAIKIKIYNLRDYTLDKHHKIDDRPYGGGPGMVMQVEPIARALKKIVGKSAKGGSASGGKSSSTKVILTSAKGKIFTQSKAHAFTKLKKLVIICGHYEGVDERVMKYVDEELSIGEFVLTGGELPALVVLDSVARLLPGVLGDSASHQDESHEQKGVLEYPHYSRPEKYQGMRVPKVLLSGDHAKIVSWRNAHRKKI